MRAMRRQFTRGFVLTTALMIVGAGAQAGVAVATPSASPSVKRTFVGLTPGTACRYGYLCAYVQGDGGYYRFDFTLSLIHI